jgi:rod shape-determining protein MreD
MRVRRWAFTVGVVLLAAILQVVVVNRIPLPLGHPDLLILVVIGMALVSGPERGALVGFLAGVVGDFLPPAGHIAGRLAFAYTVVGFVVGLFADPDGTPVIRTILLVAGASAGGVLLYSGVGALLGDARVTASSTLHLVIATVVYDVILAPFVVPLVSSVARRVEPVGSR